jgi:hypothetical protein
VVFKEWNKVILSYWDNRFTAIYRPYDFFNHLAYFNGHGTSLYSGDTGHSDGRETLLYESFSHLLANINFVMLWNLLWNMWIDFINIFWKHKIKIVNPWAIPLYLR